MELVFRKTVFDTEVDLDMAKLQALLDAIDVRERVNSKSEAKRKAVLLSLPNARTD